MATPTDWVKENMCLHCVHRTPMKRDHCHVTPKAPTQKCPWFKEIDHVSL
jgi:hypothetical protein